MSKAIIEEVGHLAEQAKAASAALARTSGEERAAALAAMACALRRESAAIVAANGRDMDAGRAAGMDEALLDRLMLDGDRVEAMACALEELAELPDPLGRVLEQRRLPDGIELARVSVPLGVVGIIYEARPNVTADAAGICLRSGNACILRGGSQARHSNEAIASVLADAAADAGMPRGCICSIGTTDRAATDALMQLHGTVDVIIPRGGAGLIRHCVETSKVPVIETGTGNCHIYVHESADAAMAEAIVVNAKCRRFGVCNAAETLLVDVGFPADALARILRSLADRGVLLHCDAAALDAAAGAGLACAGPDAQAIAASEADWETEYLGPHLAVRTIEGGVDAAVAHINRYGTRHSEAIVAADEEAIGAFLRDVDAAAVYANASTAFTDGGQVGLGAEIGISTQKLHARGPFALDALTSYKYVLRGSGQVRS